MSLQGLWLPQTLCHTSQVPQDIPNKSRHLPVKKWLKFQISTDCSVNLDIWNTVRESYICSIWFWRFLPALNLYDMVHHLSRLMMFWSFLVFSVWTAVSVSGMRQNFLGLNYPCKDLQSCPDSSPCYRIGTRKNVEGTRTWSQSAGSEKSVSCIYTLSMDTSKKCKVGLCDASLSFVFSAQQFSTPWHLEVDAVST